MNKELGLDFILAVNIHLLENWASCLNFLCLGVPICEMSSQYLKAVAIIPGF